MAFALVTGQKALASGTLTATTTLTNTPAMGNLVLNVAYSPVIVASALPTVVDGSANNMTQLATKIRIAAAEGIAIYGWIAGASQSKTYTATGFAGDTVYLNTYEFSGNFAATNGTASTFIDNGQKGTSSGTASTTTGAISPLITTTNNADMIISVLGLSAAPVTTLTANNSTSILQGNPANPGAFLADANLILTSGASSADYGWTWTGNKAYVHIAIALLPAATGGASAGNMFLVL